MRKLMYIFAWFFMGLGLSAQSSENVRQILSFNQSWKFIKNDNPEYKKAAFNDNDWRNLDLPHDFTIEGEFNKEAACGASGAFLEGGIAWYRKSFELPESVKNKTISIKFDGIYMNSQVWVNDTYLGLYPYGYSQIVYDLTGIVKPGQKNVIAVRVDNSNEPSSRYYAGTGIYRNVWLTISNQTRFDHTTGVFVSYKYVSDKSAVVQCVYEIVTMAFKGSEFEWWRRNPALNVRITKEFTLRSEIIDREGKVVASTDKKIQLSDYSEAKIRCEIPMTKPALWSADNPELYTLRSSILDENALVDNVNTTIGIRSLEYSASKGLLVNGQQEKLKGVCMHQDAGSSGSVVSKKVWIYRLAKLKKMGANAIRTSHNPFSKEFYEVCDSLGFYVMDEAFDEWNLGYDFKTNSNPGGKMKYGYHLYFNQWAETDLHSMILRSRNHPSVIMYSIGNEIPNQFKPSGVILLKKLQDICHQSDSTRLVTAGCDFIPYAEKNGFFNALDIAGYNYIGRYTSKEMYQPVKEKFPDRLYLGTETYHDPAYWLAVRDNDYVIGEFVWAGFDYLGEGLAWPKRGWDACLIDMAGNEYPEYYLRKSFWTDDPVVYLGVEYADKPETEWHPHPIKSHWNWKWNADYYTSVFVYSNCDEVELFINSISQGRVKIDEDKNMAEFKVLYLPGEAKAVGYKNDKIEAEYVVRTASEATHLQLNSNKKILKANSNDYAFLKISITDKAGNVVPNAQNQVTVNIQGDAVLAGLDNADQYSHEAYKTNSRKAFNGKLLATIKAGSTKGKILVTVNAPELQKAATEIIIQ